MSTFPTSDPLPLTPSVLARVKLLALDVDGVLTDGGVYYDDAGNETKRFHIQDGLGLVLARLAGLPVVWITGRQSAVVERRARELKVEHLRQGVRDKARAIAEVAALCHVTAPQFVGLARIRQGQNHIA